MSPISESERLRQSIESMTDAARALRASRESMLASCDRDRIAARFDALAAVTGRSGRMLARATSPMFPVSGTFASAVHSALATLAGEGGAS